MQANEQQTLNLPAGQVLTIAAPPGSAGTAIRLSRLPGGGDAQSVTAIAGADLTFGSYALPERFKIICTAGTITISMDVPDPLLVQFDTEASALLSGKVSHSLATAENDVLVGAPNPFGTWIKKTLNELKTILGLGTAAYTASTAYDAAGTAAGKIAAEISNGDLTHAPDGNSVFDALALKAPLAAPAFTGTATAERIDPTILVIAEKTPVNAVAATKILTFTGNAGNNETVSIGGQAYTFQTAIQAAGVKATGVLTLTGNAVENEVAVMGDRTYRWRTGLAAIAASKNLVFTAVAANTETITIDAIPYTFKTALTEAKATGILTATAQPQDGARVILGSTVYIFRDTLAAAYDVKIGALATDSLDNLIAAINKAAGEGTLYGTGTVVHPSVSAAAGAGDTVNVTALAIGTAGNVISSVEYSPGLSWGGATLTGGLNAVLNEILVEATTGAEIDNLVAAAMTGVGAGTKFSTGQPVLVNVTLTKTDATNMLATAKVAGTAGNSIAIAETCAQVAWAGGAVFLSGGYAAAVANDVVVGGSAELSIDALVAAVNNAAGEGTTYATGTLIHADITGSKTAANIFTATAKVAGEAGNSLASTETMTNASWGTTTLLGGEGIEVANDVLRGVSAEASIDNLVAAINGAAGAGTTYGTGTVANASITSVKTDTDKVTATAKVKGTSGNAIALAETLANASWAGGAVFMTGGVDGTVGVANETCADGTNLYHCLATNTIADANWRKITLASL